MMLNGGQSKLRSELANELANMNTGLRKSFLKIKQEFDEHLQSINDNTSEITILEGNICDIDKRLSKIEERMDNIHMMVKALLTPSNFKIELTPDEQKLFLVFYTTDDPINVKQIVSKMSATHIFAEELILSMTDKGIPMHRTDVDGETHFKLDEEFRLIQAREKIIKIDPEVSRKYQNKLLYSFFSE